MDQLEQFRSFVPRVLQRLLLFTGDSDSDQIKVIKLIKTSDKSVNGDPARTWINMSNSDLSCQGILIHK